VSLSDLAALGAAILMLAVIFCDLRYMQIPAPLVAAIVALFCLLAVTALPFEESWHRIAVALIVLFAGIIAFAFNLFGGGDVKALSATLLLVPFAQLALFALLFSAALIGGVLLVGALRRVFSTETSRWAFLRNERRFPMGISIGAALLALTVAQGA
jgi:prepilin peptidase CpaA